MLEKIYEKLINTSTLAVIYGVIASICAICTVGVLGNQARPDIGKISPHGVNEFTGSVLGNLGETPLAVAYRIFSLFSIPTEWLPTLSRYLSENPARTSVFLCVAFALGGAAAYFCGERTTLPTLPASTLWICLTICMQNGRCGFWWLVALSFGIICVKAARRRDPGWIALAIVDIAIAAIALVTPLLVLINPYSPGARSSE